MLNAQTKEIRAKKRYFYFLDECHLVWGDACGYTWGRRGIKFRIPMNNERIRQTYFGVLNVLTGKVLIKRFSTANAVTTIAFLTYLLQKHSGAKLTICWDGVSYHRSNLIAEFIRQTNRGVCRKERRLTLFRLPANAPEENLMEEVWLYGKSAIRKNPKDLSSFEAVRNRLERSLKSKKFNFMKLQKLQKVLQII